MKHEFLSKFEQNPDRKVNFAFVVALFEEIESLDFNIEFDFFVKAFCCGCFNQFELHTVSVWIDMFLQQFNRINSLDCRLLKFATYDLSFLDEHLEDIEDYLIERAND